MEAAGAADLDDFARRVAGADDTTAAHLANLRRYAGGVSRERRYRKDAFETGHSKTTRPLGLFDCIAAPCTDECPVDQDVPQYMAAVREGRFADAVAITRRDNPLASILGHVCDHRCEHACIRTHYDEPLAIREMKRFIMSQEAGPAVGERAPARGQKVAVIGAGPGRPVGRPDAGPGRVRGHRLREAPLRRGHGGRGHPRLPPAAGAHRRRPGRPRSASGCASSTARRRARTSPCPACGPQGFGPILVAVGAQVAKRLGIPGEEAEGVLDGIAFLRSVREGRPLAIGKRVAVVGAGDTAMDCARTARRLGAEVTIVYRRTIDQMPADREEVRAMLEEGVAVEELSLPVRLRVEDGHLAGVVCTRMEYRGERDAGGRKVPVAVEGSEYEMPFDTLLLAVSQHAVLGFFDGPQPELTRGGYLACDPETLETSLPGVYAAGDVAAHGPASIVRAAADGKRAAAAIIAGARPPQAPHRPPDDLPGLLRRRAHREWRVPVRHTPLTLRGGFAETTFTYTDGGGPGRGEPLPGLRSLLQHLRGRLPQPGHPHLCLASRWRSTCRRCGSRRAGSWRRATAPFRVEQRLQVAVLTDFCNECGNCATFCPTAGTPYRDKPRLYLDRADFEAQQDNAFMLLGQGVIEARSAGETHRVEVDGARHLLDAAGHGAPGSGHLGGAGSPAPRRAPPTARCPCRPAPRPMPCW